ncbi:hypothetical protein [Clostridium sp. CF012]|uniref:hypothetical protein n=1 Tax=Clostridium sp. CF012 TaxID=2843319 RepID=UPI001C0CD407|nr:hypothetical protein [Clostridium sp. CF012]MBU3147015.1 hypothetical protein [Clostridium sp. CF012]
MNTTKLTLEDFKAKAIKKIQDRKMSIDIEVEGYGVITFNRPTENELLAYVGKSSDAIKTDKDDNTISQDMVAMLESAKDLVYSVCGFLKDAEFQKTLEVIDPLDSVTKVFGIKETMSIAADIAKEFMDDKTMEKVETEIKN